MPNNKLKRAASSTDAHLKAGLEKLSTDDQCEKKDAQAAALSALLSDRLDTEACVWNGDNVPLGQLESGGAVL